jgi:hypothetical protein
MRKRKSSGTDGLLKDSGGGNGFQNNDRSAAGPEKGAVRFFPAKWRFTT